MRFSSDGVIRCRSPCRPASLAPLTPSGSNILIARCLTTTSSRRHMATASAAQSFIKVQECNRNKFSNPWPKKPPNHSIFQRKSLFFFCCEVHEVAEDCRQYADSLATLEETLSVHPRGGIELSARFFDRNETRRTKYLN